MFMQIVCFNLPIPTQFVLSLNFPKQHTEILRHSNYGGPFVVKKKRDKAPSLNFKTTYTIYLMFYGHIFSLGEQKSFGTT